MILEEYSKLSNDLLSKVNSIFSTEQISFWKSDAHILEHKYKILLHELQNEIEIQKRIYQTEDNEHKSQNIFVRLLGSNPAEKTHYKIELFNQSIHQITEVISKLEYWMKNLN